MKIEKEIAEVFGLSFRLDGGREMIQMRDISTSLTFVQELSRRINQNEVCQEHILDILDDALAV